MATKGKYPYKAFMLTPSHNTHQVTVVEAGWYSGYEELDTGTKVRRAALFSTEKAAIAFGRKSLEQRRARLAISLANIEKHEANLKKAEDKNG